MEVILTACVVDAVCGDMMGLNDFGIDLFGSDFNIMKWSKVSLHEKYCLLTFL